jgi:transglutaminase-like putative cysteine protease
MDFVRSKVVYVRDPNGTEYVISPVRMLSQINTDGRTMGDCDDHTLLFNSMLNSIGFRARAVGVRLFEDRYDHVISSVLVGNQWVDIDTCIKSGQQPRYDMRLVGGISA